MLDHDLTIFSINLDLFPAFKYPQDHQAVAAGNMSDDSPMDGIAYFPKKPKFFFWYVLGYPTF